jgi:hypothetical protein
MGILTGASDANFKHRPSGSAFGINIGYRQI